MSVGWQLAFFVAGLLTGWAFPVRRRRSLGGPAVGETLDQSLARLTAHQHRPGVRMGSGQVVMGPQQPRPQVQSRIPAAPPRGSSGKPILPEHTVWR